MKGKCTEYLLTKDQNSINITITILDIIYSPIFYLKYDILETEFCIRVQVVLTQLDLINRVNLCLRIPATTSIRVGFVKRTQHSNSDS
jgi:hypothetical protein